MHKLIYSAFLISLMISSASFAMEEEGWEDSSHSYSDLRKLKEIRIEKAAELDRILEEYREKGRPIGLAVACGSEEMPKKITEMFGSKVPVKENWISLDLLLTDSDSCRRGPHIRMDATNEHHWQQVVKYLKGKEIEVSTVAFTAFGPDIDSDLLRKTIMPVVKTGGLLIYPGYFPTDYGDNRSADRVEFGDLIVNFGALRSQYDPHYLSDLKNYHDPKGAFYHKEKELEKSTREWIKEFANRDEGEARQKLRARVYVNRVVSFNPDYLTQVQKGKLIRKDYLSPYPISQLFLKTDKDFTRDYLTYFKDYMTEIGFDSSSYKTYSKEKAEIYGVEEYVYPEDGTFDLAPYDRPSLVFIKQ